MKYSKKILQTMALRLIKAKRLGDPRYIEFVLVIGIKSGKSSGYIEQQIQAMARG